MPDNFKVSAQWSRRMNSLKFYLTLRVHGRKAYEELIGRQLKLAGDFAALVRHNDLYELAMEPVLPILNLRLKASGRSVHEIDSLHEAIVDEVTRSGERWISLTRVQGRSVIRLMVISYLTTQSHMNALWEALLTACLLYTSDAADERSSV